MEGKWQDSGKPECRTLLVSQCLPAGEDVPIRARAEQPLPPPAASLGQRQDLSPTISLQVLPLFDKYQVSPLSVAI